MKILVLTPFGEVEWEWFGKSFVNEEWDIANLNLFGKKPWVWFYSAVQSLKMCGKADVVITHHPYMTFYIALVYWIFGVKKPHYAFSFNHGNGRFLKGINLLIARRVFRYVDGFVVFSEKEKEIYGRYYNIPYEKMSFVHWAVKSPEFESEMEFVENRPYICCMGRNNRDFEVFIEAVRKVGVNAIIVCSPHQIDEDSLPRNVIVRYGVSMKEAMGILAESIICVTPLKDASTGAGHITIVSSLQLGIPQIITKLQTVDDYFIHGKHGLYVEQGSVESLSDAISELLDSPEQLKSMSAFSQQFSNRWLTESASKEFLEMYIKNIGVGLDPPSEPDGWSAYKKEYQSLR